ncbi:hypothetical protein DPX16_1808 [Anabarilius grahami]|uniref:Uncharacterized protein n=1 Tax=Anabarilius grahami TaxID=495550 RepID=A0A3N0Y6T6_ANAGA|nr:hypothetical protein DPX16_1808 [Anabarilius grahami]
MSVVNGDPRGIIHGLSAKTDGGPSDIQRTRRDQQDPSRRIQNRTGQEPINGLSIDTLPDNMTQVVLSIHHAGMDSLLRNCATGCRVDEAFAVDDLVDSISADTSGLRCGHVQLRIVFITPVWTVC